jgi:hypothetical protein
MSLSSEEQTRDDEVAALEASLRSSRERLLAVIAGVSEEQFKRRPPAAQPGSTPPWSIAEVLAHLLHSERLHAGRILQSLEQDGSTLTPLAAAASDDAARAGRGAPVPQLIHGLLASRREIERLLERATGEVGGLERAVEHPQLGRQTIAWMLRERIVEHEAEHVAQIEAIRQALDAGVGRS